MTGAQMVTRVQNRTKFLDVTRTLDELNSAKDWMYNRLYDSQNGPDTLVAFATEVTLNAATRTYDIATTYTAFIGLKQLSIKLPGDTGFTAAQEADAAEDIFREHDHLLASDTTTDLATGHPVLFEVVNFGQVRFSPMLPSSTVLRIDYFKRPADIANSSSALEIVQALHELVVDKATAQVFALLDDDRQQYWDGMAHARLGDALYLVRQRAQGPVHTQPFRRHRRRFI